MNINDIVSTGKKATRDGFGEGLHEAGRRNDQVIALCADLLGSLRSYGYFAENAQSWR